MSACTPPAVGAASPAIAAIVDGQPITMAAYQARLRVSQTRDPFAGMPEAMPSPAPSQRLEDFTIEQLVREAIVREQAAQHGISVSEQAVNARITQLQDKAGAPTFAATIARNGFSRQSFWDYERALLIEVALLKMMARRRIETAANELKAGQSFDGVVARWNDDAGTAPRHGEVGWVRAGDLPEPALAAAAESLPAGSRSGVIETSRGFVIATVLGRRADQAHLAIILVLAPSVDLFSPLGTPAWFTTFLDDQEAVLKRDGKLSIRVGSHAGS